MKTSLTCFFVVLVFEYALAGSPATSTDQLLGQYFLIQKSLASDSSSGIAGATAKLATISRQFAGTQPQVKTQLIALADAAAKLQAKDLKSARSGFGELSDRLIEYLQAARAKRNPPYQFYCPMVKKNWLQPDKEIRNPYYGSSMLKCGELVQSVQSVEQHTEHNHH